MRERYVPLAYETLPPSDEGSEEIRRAIDAVRSSGRLQRSDREAQRSVPDPGREYIGRLYDRLPMVAVAPTNRVDAATIVKVRGHAPLEFFRWFDELRSQLEDQQTMLEQCCFEECEG